MNDADVNDNVVDDDVVVDDHHIEPRSPRAKLLLLLSTATVTIIINIAVTIAVAIAVATTVAVSVGCQQNTSDDGTPRSLCLPLEWDTPRGSPSVNKKARACYTPAARALLDLPRAMCQASLAQRPHHDYRAMLKPAIPEQKEKGYRTKYEKTKSP